MVYVGFCEIGVGSELRGKNNQFISWQRKTAESTSSDCIKFISELELVQQLLFRKVCNPGFSFFVSLCWCSCVAVFYIISILQLSLPFLIMLFIYNLGWIFVISGELWYPSEFEAAGRCDCWLTEQLVLLHVHLENKGGRSLLASAAAVKQWFKICCSGFPKQCPRQLCTLFKCVHTPELGSGQAS